MNQSVLLSSKPTEITEKIVPLAIEGLHQTLSPHLKWLASGKPIIEGLTQKEVDVSLTHDEEFCLCVSGYGPQGCDILPITHRSQEDWIALLSFKQEKLLNDLVSQNSDTLDIAGSRIWTAIEALRKATNVKDLTLSIESLEGERVLLKGIANNQSLLILTFPITLSLGSQRMVAFIVKKNKESLVSHPKIVTPEKIYQINSHNPFIVRWPVSYQDTANPSQRVYFSRFFNWMGKLRDLSIWSIREKLGEFLATKQCGMVTNFAETQIWGEAGLNDVIEAHFWVKKISGMMGSTVDFYCDWFKVLPNETTEKIATSTLQMTWVNFGETSAKPAPLPPFLDSFLHSLYHPELNPHQGINSKIEDRLGKVLYQGSKHTLKGEKLHELTLTTTLEDTDAVGNINFANYAVFQGRVRDHFFYQLMPELYKRGSKLGEFRCVNSRVNYLREAFPFEEITVTLLLKKIHEQGLSFTVEYFSKKANGHLEKIATGEQDVLWFIQKQGYFTPSSIPLSILNQLLAVTSYQLPVNS